MNEDKIQEIARCFKELNIDQATIKVLGKEYIYKALPDRFFSFGFIGSVLVSYKRSQQKRKIIELPKDRITIFDYTNNKVITYPFPLDGPKSFIELAEWLKKEYEYDIADNAYLITINDNNDG